MCSQMNSYHMCIFPTYMYMVHIQQAMANYTFGRFHVAPVLNTQEFNMAYLSLLRWATLGGVFWKVLEGFQFSQA